MMANQLALLDLTTLATSSSAAVREELAFKTRGRGETPMRRLMMSEFAQHWARLRLKSQAPWRSNHGGVTAPPDEIVAFSDPNDILSWLVTKDDIRLPEGDASKVSLTNVYLSNNEFQIPALFSDPTVAHTGYFNNQTVLDLLVCGMENGAMKPCPPSPAVGADSAHF